jgi:hypothetical protein
VAIQLSDVTVVVNNETVGVIPNSVSYTEGFGEQAVRAVSIGGGKTEQVFANDLESNYSKVSFDLPSTVDNIDLARKWKVQGNANVVSLQAQNADGNIVRTFTGAAVTADYDVEMGVDSNIAIEFMSNSAT